MFRNLLPPCPFLCPHVPLRRQGARTGRSGNTPLPSLRAPDCGAKRPPPYVCPAICILERILGLVVGNQSLENEQQMHGPHLISTVPGDCPVCIAYVAAAREGEVTHQPKGGPYRLCSCFSGKSSAARSQVTRSQCRGNRRKWTQRVTSSKESCQRDGGPLSLMQHACGHGPWGLLSNSRWHFPENCVAISPSLVHRA